MCLILVLLYQFLFYIMDMKKIYRIEVFCNIGFIEPEYAYQALSDFYLDRAQAEEKLKNIQKLSKEKLIDLVNGDPEDRNPTIEEYNLID